VKWLAAICALSACTEQPILAFAPPSGWSSVLIAVERTSGTHLDAYAATDPLILSPSDERDFSVTAIFYAEPLARLGLAAGSIDLSAPRTRPLPTPFLSALLRSIAGGEVGPVEDLSPASEHVTRLAIPAEDSASCAMAGRCVELNGADIVCSDDCVPLPRRPAVVIAAPANPAPPAATMPPVIACAPGWTRVASTPPTCAPPAVPARVACPASEVQWYGASICAPIGRPCPVSGWPEALPAGRPVRWVAPGGGLAPDGTAAFTTIADALLLAPASVVIALSRGTHPGEVALGPDQALFGACARDTEIASISAARGRIEDLRIAGAVTVRAGAELQLEGVALDGRGIDVSGTLVARQIASTAAIGAALRVLGGGDAQVDGLVIENAGDDALIATGARLEAARVVITTAIRGAIQARANATLVLHGAALFGAQIGAREGSRLEIADTAVLLDARRGGSLDGITVEGSTLAGARIAIDRPSNIALFLVDARADVEDLWLHDSGAQDIEAMIVGAGSSTVTARRVVIDTYDGAAVALIGAANAAFDDFVAGGARGYGNAPGGGGAMAVFDAARLTMRRAWIHDVLDLGVWQHSTGSTTLTDVTVVDVAKDRAQLRGYALLADQGRLSVTRASVARFATRGFEIASAAELTDLDVRDGLGRGIRVAGGALTAARVRVTSVIEQGVEVTLAGTATITDLAIDGVTLDHPDRDALGVHVDQAFLRATRARVEDTEIGVAMNAGSAVLTDLVVDRAHRRRRKVDGAAVYSDRHTRLTLDRARLSGFETGGILLYASSATITDAAIDGASSAVFDFEREISSGIFAYDGTAVAAERVRITGTAGFGVSLRKNTRVRLDDAEIVSTRGPGIQATKGSALMLDGVTLEDCSDIGVAIDAETQVEATDLHIIGVSASSAGQGVGIQVNETSSAELRDFSIEGAIQTALEMIAGITAPGPTVVTLENGTLRGSRVGIRSLLNPTRDSFTATHVRLSGNLADFDP